MLGFIQAVLESLKPDGEVVRLVCNNTIHYNFDQGRVLPTYFTGKQEKCYSRITKKTKHSHLHGQTTRQTQRKGKY